MDIQEHDQNNLNQKCRHEKKSLFRKVHKELLGMFKHQHSKNAHHEREPPEIPERPRRHFSTEKGNVTVNDNGRIHFASTSNTHKSQTEKHTVSDSNPSPRSEIYSPLPQPDNEIHDYDYPQFDHMTDIFRAATRRRRLPVPPPESPDRPTTPPEGFLLNSIESEGPKYVSLATKQAEHLFRDNLTQDDFFQYTVTETAHCFKHCGLDDFAELCLENRLDGSFFRNVDCNELRKDPFGLTEFHILKVTKMIYNGWRPKVYK
ncbi:uncharacterized protein LOC123551054 [Mercenaria mercenaria]|uniref:uncharacterized protein LOC123551054 n=1 Tax=Mercenaria mercenaria TaxID=6596 RepID=UPI00234F707D|nr:uncharacterized protein LOC123551054 [Mercenaria mercenaria]